MLGALLTAAPVVAGFGAVHAQTVPAGAKVFYGSRDARTRFNTVFQLSDGTVLVGGMTEDITKIAPSAPRTLLSATAADGTAITNPGGTGTKFGFLLRLSNDLATPMQLAYFPRGAVEDVRHVKATSGVAQTTGALFVSGTKGDGYYIARLNSNFLKGVVPTAMNWAFNVGATGDHKSRQPWDVGSDGKVVYTRGEPFGTGWCAVYRLTATGQLDVVPYWRYHWGTRVADGANTEGHWTPAASNSSVNVAYSALVMKTGNRCDLRSWTRADFDAILPDGNGSTKKGKWPNDLFFANPGDPVNPTSTASNAQGGYTGYRLGSNPTHRVGSITIDRRDNSIYVGYSVQSRLPDGLPDFEPAVIAFDGTGAQKWWSRLYRERNPDGTTNLSTPDQYVDGLTIDPTNGQLVVLARSHGNNVTNLWPGWSNSFHRQFTGTNGNIHVSWVGKLRLVDGTLDAASYNAEYVDGSTNYGTNYSDPLLAGWPNHNAGWPDLNTTRCEIDIRADVNGAVYLLGNGRRTVTTSNAFQPMLKYTSAATKPAGYGASVWNDYVRVYVPALSTLAYTSCLTGNWDPATGAGGDNTDLVGLYPFSLGGGAFVVGYQRVDTNATTGVSTTRGNPIPTANVPAWGASAPTPNTETAIIARLVW